MTKPEAIVICGDGINCDAETSWALELAGFTANRLHTSTFLENPDKVFEAQLLAIPGGFSFGDEIASGKVLAVKLKQKLKEAFYAYIEKGGLVIGICNGFQVLTQMGLLPVSSHDAPPVVSLTKNAGGKFINRWVDLEIDTKVVSPFFQSLEHIQLPIRHGEGRLCLGTDAKPEIIEEVKKHAVLRYSEDINGSFDKIAALTNSAGNVLGLMPHPEAFVRWTQHPSWNGWDRVNGDSIKSKGQGTDGVSQLKGKKEHCRERADGLEIFKNAARAVG